MNMPPLELQQEILQFLHLARLGHMATVDDAGIPAVIPICFVVDGLHVITVIDDKPKNVEPLKLQRIQNLQSNPNMAIVVDRYDEDWNRLGWVLLRGLGEIFQGQSTEQRNGISLLRDKYEQYRGMNLSKQPIIRMAILSARHWGDISPNQAEAQS